MSSGTLAITLIPVRALWVAMAIATTAMVSCSPHSREQAETKVWYRMAPYNADPLNFDAFPNQIAFRPVLASLVSHYSAGQVRGIVARSWTHSPDFKVWTFYIRKGLTFSDSEPITALRVTQSLKRVFKLLNERHSKSGLAEYARSITHSDDRVTLKFNISMPKLLNRIDFGMYSIASPKDYDAISGKWNNPSHVTASGAYTIRAWDQEGIHLALRADFPEDLRHPFAPKAYKILSNPSQAATSDIAISDSLDDSLERSHHFSGGLSSGIGYVHCVGWANPQSPVSDPRVRLGLRTSFYKNLGKPWADERDFFPKILSTPALEIQLSENIQSHAHAGQTIRFRPSAKQSTINQRYNQAIDLAAKAIGMNVSSVPMPLGQLLEHLNTKHAPMLIDVAYMETSILADDAVEDVRFMFNSKEGIRLPDPGGAIRMELKKRHPDLRKVNRQLWSDGIIWPTAHFSHGVWTLGTLDLSKIDLALPPTDLSWIGTRAQ